MFYIGVAKKKGNNKGGKKPGELKFGPWEYEGKEIIRYGDVEFLGDVYSIEVEGLEDYFFVMPEDSLKRLLETAEKHEDYESASEIKKELDRREKRRND